MADGQHAKLARTIFTQYRDNFGLFWRIMAPFAVITIALNIVIFIRGVSMLDNIVGDIPDNGGPKLTSSIGTVDGVHPTILYPETDTFGDRPIEVMITPLYPLGSHWRLFPLPHFSSTDDSGVTRFWHLNARIFSIFSYTPHSFLLLMLFPMSLVVVHISRGSAASLTAREAWQQTRPKAFKVWCTFLCMGLIAFWIKSADRAIAKLIYWLALPPIDVLPLELIPILLSGSVVLSVCLQFYFIVTLSLYNPCLVLENRSIMGIFRRSHALVKGARWRFLGIYLLTGWLASVMTSVLLALALLVLSAFIPHLAPIRDALSPLTFLSLFIGAEVQVALSEVLSVPATVTIRIITGLITTFLVPIWAILTTHLYLQRVDAIKEVRAYTPTIAGEVSNRKPKPSHPLLGRGASGVE